MEEEIEVTCARPTGGPVGVSPPEKEVGKEATTEKEVNKTMVQVGKKAPDFQAPAFHEGKFKQIKLSDYLRKWLSYVFIPEILPLFDLQS